MRVESPAAGRPATMRRKRGFDRAVPEQTHPGGGIRVVPATPASAHCAARRGSVADPSYRRPARDVRSEPVARLRTSTAQEVFGVHAPPAGRLELQDFDEAVTGGDQEATGATSQQDAAGSRWFARSEGR